jgi:1-deoxy-D-xylulose-5-phosphate reductoisomerase
MRRRWITILGATGSIGQSTLEVLALHPNVFGVWALTAYHNIPRLVQQSLLFRPRLVVVPDELKEIEFIALWREKSGDTPPGVLLGDEGLCAVASHESVDLVMAAIVGAAGLSSTLAAAKSGKTLLLANKEALVMAGELLLFEVAHSGAILLPVDSEHNAIHQCLIDAQQGLKSGFQRLILTASGGPFLRTPREQWPTITVAEACCHPKWSMGRKISVDSATMMNKALEVIEACWLFGVEPSQIDVFVHPQSIVHSMVSFVDGSVLAQMGCPDMRIPIAYALGYPFRLESGASALDLLTAGALSFEALDGDRFPAVALAKDVFKTGRSASVVFNAANEVAVACFLAGHLGFGDIVPLIQSVLFLTEFTEITTIEEILEADSLARKQTKLLIENKQWQGVHLW